MVRRSVFDQLFNELRNIRSRLEELENLFSGMQFQPVRIPESKLFSLPDHLRQTYLIVASKGECNATEVSNVTGRSRAVESCYLNQLARTGWLTKYRVSKTVNFRLLSHFSTPAQHETSLLVQRRATSKIFLRKP